jgi:hypothetical protein
LLAGKYGAVGASVASVVAEIMVTVATFIFALKVIPVHINIGSIFQPILAALPIIPISLLFDCVIDLNISYLSATVTTSVVLYVSIMVAVFKNEQASQILRVVVRKIKAS